MKNKKGVLFGSVLIASVLLVSLGGPSFAASTDSGTPDGTNQPCQTGDMVSGGHGFGAGRGYMGKIPSGGNRISGILDDLVKNNIISQDTADRITAYESEKSEERKTEMQKIKGMTAEERQAYLDSKKSGTKDSNAGPFSDLVEADIITQEEADAIEQYMQEEMEASYKKNLSEKLDALIKAGTITQSQEDSILDCFMNNREDKQDMKDGQKPAAGSRKNKESGILQALIDDGVLTRDEADAVKNALFAPRRPA